MTIDHVLDLSELLGIAFAVVFLPLLLSLRHAAVWRSESLRPYRQVVFFIALIVYFGAITVGAVFVGGGVFWLIRR